jgi:HEAT repeat protein
MSTHETLAARFARCVSLFREPGAREDQKAEFRALLGLLKDSAVSLRAAGGRLEINGILCEGESLTGLVQRLDLHDIGEIALPAEPPPQQLFELVRALADQPGTDDVPSRLAAAGVDRIRVTLTSLEPPQPSPPVASSDDVESREAIIPRTSRPSGTEGILRGEPWRDTKSVPIDGVPLVSHDPPPPPAADALPGTARPASPEPSAPPAPSAPAVPPGGAGARPPAAAPPAPPAASSPGAPRPAAGSLPLPAGAADVVAQLTRDPAGPAVGDLLAALVHHTELALKQRRPDQLLGVVSGIVRVEESVPEASGVRRQYAIALRRLYTKPVLDALVRLLSEPKYRADAVVALRRGGAGAVEVLMDLLVTAPTMDERRSAFDALRHMTEGTEQLVHALEHQEWFVVRNVAELIGELGIEGAVPALARRLDHEDERVRKAVALALAKIGTRAAVEPLRRALHDPSSEVRMQVALGIGGQKAAALAMPLVVAMDEEKDEGVLRELILALGRIGSPDAVQALIKCSQPAGRIFGRKSAGLRLAAVEGLRLAATPAARGTLDGLTDDSDKQVRAAARAAVSELGRKRRR